MAITEFFAGIAGVTRGRPGVTRCGVTAASRRSSVSGSVFGNPGGLVAATAAGQRDTYRPGDVARSLAVQPQTLRVWSDEFPAFLRPSENARARAVGAGATETGAIVQGMPVAAVLRAQARVVRGMGRRRRRAGSGSVRALERAVEARRGATAPQPGRAESSGDAPPEEHALASPAGADGPGLAGYARTG